MRTLTAVGVSVFAFTASLVSASPRLREVYNRGLVRIRSDVALTPAQARAAAHAVRDAYRFDLKASGLKASASLRSQINLKVLSPKAFHKVGGTSYGVTLTANDVAVPVKTVRRSSGGALDTVGHELGHVIDSRLAHERLRWVPMYLQEGKEYVLGGMYVDANRRTDQDRFTIHTELGRLTRPQAMDILSRLKTEAAEERMRDLHDGETTGGLFVEFLRTRLNGGVPDTLARLSAMERQVGRGTLFASAFKKEFGVTREQALARFGDYLDATQGNVKARLAGTIWEESRSAHYRALAQN